MYANIRSSSMRTLALLFFMFGSSFLLAQSTFIFQDHFGEKNGDIEIRGQIEELSQNSLKILGITFFVSDTTTILDANDNAISFAALIVGQNATVTAALQDDNTFLASRIKVDADGTGIIVGFTGRIESLSDTNIVVGGISFVVADSTRIVDKDNNIISFSELFPDLLVEIIPVVNIEGVLFAGRIKVIEELVTSITSLPDNAVKPDDFLLLQNYPNPFNPATTITFEIPELSDTLLKVKLTIFNLQGQAVRRVVEEPLSSGTYQKYWDGKDDVGNVLPTGVYLYQLKAGSVSKTKRMLLIK